MSIGALYKQALQAAVAGQAKVYDYSDETDYVALWGTSQAPSGVPSQLANWGKGVPALVVVWDGGLPAAAPSADDRLLFKHLTPLDWALAFSSRAFDTDKLKTQATFAIVIVDLTSQRDADLWSTRMRYQLLADMPWVTLCAPLPFLVDSKTRVGLRPCLPILNTASEQATHESSASQVRNAASLLGRAEDGKWRIVHTAIAATLAKAPAGGTGVRLRDLGRQWAASLAQVDEHHDLNNIVGPYLIADLVGIARPEEVRDAKYPVEPFLIDAFLTRLKWAGLTGSHDQSSAPKVDYTPPQFAEQFTLLAVDDRLDRGWSEVLAFLLGVKATTKANDQVQEIGSSGQVQLFGTTNPHTLLSSLGISIPGIGVEIDLAHYTRRLYDSPIADSNERPWALVLDLRLFAGKPDDARDWYLTLARVAKALCVVETELAWPGFSSDLPRLERWINPVHSSHVDPRAPTEESLALSLLPRLCALRWPAVPIIVFSASQQRALLERLGGYGNINIASAKPNCFSGNLVSQIDSFLYRFTGTISKARSLALMSKMLSRLTDHRRTVLAGRGSILHGGKAISDEGHGIHLECYIDESGNSESIGEKQRFAISAVVGLYDSEISAEALHRKMCSGTFNLPIGNGASGLLMKTQWGSVGAVDGAIEIPKQGIGIYDEIFRELSKRARCDELIKACPLAILRQAAVIDQDIDREFKKQASICSCELSNVPHPSQVLSQLRSRILARTKVEYSEGKRHFCASLHCSHVHSITFDVPSALLDRYTREVPIDLDRRMYEHWGKSVKDMLRGRGTPAIFCFHAELLESTGNIDFLDGSYDETIGLLVEAICFDAIPMLLEDVHVKSQRVFFATRQLSERKRSELQDCFFRWGAQPHYKESNTDLFERRLISRNQYYDKLISVLNENYHGDQTSAAVTTLEQVKTGAWGDLSVYRAKPILPSEQRLNNDTCLSAAEFHDGAIVSNPNRFLSSGSPVTINSSAPGMQVRAMHRRRSTALRSAGRAEPILVGAAAFKLSSKAENIRPRVIHGLADMAPRGYIQGDLESIPLVVKHISGKYFRSSQVAFRLLLDGCQNADSGNGTNAIGRLLDALDALASTTGKGKFAWNRSKITSISDLDLLIAKIGGCADSLTGIELLTLAASNVGTINTAVRLFETALKFDAPEDFLAQKSKLDLMCCSATDVLSSEALDHAQMEPEQPVALGSPPSQAISVAVPASAPGQSGASTPTVDQTLLLTVSRIHGPLSVLDDASGVQYAMHRPLADLSIGQVVSCVANGKRAEVGIRRLPMVVMV